MVREEGWLQEDRNCCRPHFEATEKKTIELLFLDMCFVVFIEDQVTKVQLTEKVDVRWKGIVWIKRKLSGQVNQSKCNPI